MSRYSVRVQLITWYEVAVIAPSPIDAQARAETLGPAAIQARGKLVRQETGLADPFSLKLIDGLGLAHANGPSHSLPAEPDADSDES